MARIPDFGRSETEILEALRNQKENDWSWKEGRSFSLVYHAGSEHQSLLERAYSLFLSENRLSARAFPSLAKLEREVLELAAPLFSVPEEGGGVITAGGTESAILALKAYRDSSQKPEPELVLPRSAHPAYLKAAHYLGVKPVITEVGDDLRADPDAISRALTDSTLAIVASAPSFPHGLVDPIERLGRVADARGIGLHVDASLGGFALPWIRRLGHPVPAYDLAVPGVTSISGDLHKYGFGAKGAGVNFFRSKELRRHQFFATDQWSGGLFASPGVLGTRSGGALAAAWAALQSLGCDGYLRLFEGIMRTTQKIQEGVSTVPGLCILGRPEMSVFAIAADVSGQVDLFSLADEMERRGWQLDRLNRPDAIHFIITPVHANIATQLVTDLRASADLVRGKFHKGQAGESAELYGMTSTFARSGTPIERALGSLEDRL